MPESEEFAKTRDELIESAEVKATVGKKVIKEWHEAGHLGKSGKGVANSPERFWKLDIGRSEPPVLAIDQHGQPAPEKMVESPESRSVATPIPISDQATLGDVLEVQ